MAWRRISFPTREKLEVFRHCQIPLADDCLLAPSGGCDAEIGTFPHTEPVLPWTARFPYVWSRRCFSQCDCCKCLRQFARDGAIQIRQNDNGNPIFGVVGHVRVKPDVLCRRTVPLPTGANLRLTNKESLTRSRSWYRSCDPH